MNYTTYSKSCVTLYNAGVAIFIGLLFTTNLNYCFTSNTTKMGYHKYKKCIEACLKCAALCNHCSTSCLQEKDIKMMALCIQMDMECASLCYASAQLMSMGSAKSIDICKLCAEVCTACADECGKHENEHCKECADACRKCAKECKKM